jgi:NAD(P)-dependent dehydrogenase (short-subunit alcohol dehydrogenase family)
MLAVVADSNRGIGIALCKELIMQGCQVIGVCHTANEELNKLEVSLIEGIDLKFTESIERLSQHLKDTSIDLLINNAGQLISTNIDHVPRDILLEMYLVNAFAPIYLVHKLKDRLRHGAKVVMVTSRLGSIDDNQRGSAYGYRMSKAALNAGSKSLSNDLKEKGVSVAIIHPGHVRTDMTQNNGLINASDAAKGILKRIENLDLNNTGTFWHINGEILPW